MKKVLVFSLNYYPRFIGGAEVAIKEITNRIDPADIEFHMITLRFDSNLPKTEKIGNVLVHRIGFAKPDPAIAELKRFPLHLNKYLYQFFAAGYAAKLHRENHYDAIWAMMAHSCAIPAGMFKKRYPGVKYLLTLQEGDPPEHIERMMKPVWPLFAQGFAQADALQAISNFLLAWGKRMGFKGEGRVIPNAVDTQKFGATFAAEEIGAMKELLGKKEGDVFLVTTSRLVYKNAVDDVIRALPLLPENISFLIYGIGPDESALRSLAKGLGVESRARFMGQIAHDEMPLMLASTDIFIRPSRSEGMGNSFIEAMATGLPVIATQEGGIADFLFDAKRNPGKAPTGWAVDADAPDQIARAAQDILANPDAVRAAMTNARDMVFAKYDWNSIAKEMKALFDRLLNQA
ncbi:MAG: 1,2-diacylglycerol 3-glucosyltransferase [Parcubacteria group bacterium]|nr:1,2-diacylglycerol 3-glucosyltransferase [Parcubacteria group bacterium]